jgi:prepilin-type N-terminal cleavage/methylation domain-containing protein
MKCAHNKNQTGFTLVEISIVMIIIGLLIGGTFGGRSSSRICR